MSQPSSKRAAQRSFVEDIQRSLSRFHRRAQWRPRYGDDDCTVATLPRLIPVSCKDRSDLYLAAVFGFHAEKEEGRRAWRVVLDSYYYALCLNDDLDAEMVAWHWHPGTDWWLPHVHVHWREAPIDDFGRVHIPTSYVTFEQVLLFLMQDRRIQAVAHVGDATEYFAQKLAESRRGGMWFAESYETE